MPYMDQETLAAVETARKNMCDTLKTNETPLFRARAAHGLQHYHGSLEQVFDSNLAMLERCATERDTTVKEAMHSSIVILCGHALGMNPTRQQRDKIKEQMFTLQFMDV